MGEVVLKADSLYSFLEKRRGSKLGQLLTWVVFPLRSPSWLTSPPSPVTPQLCPYTCPEKSALYGDCASGYIRSNYCQRFCMVQELDGNRAKDKYIKLKLVSSQL